MAHKHFNIKRFSGYLKYDLSNNGKLYLLFALGLFIVLLIFQSVSMISDYKITKVDFMSRFIIALTPSALLCIGSSFPAFRNSIATQNYLLLPVSAFEKFVVEFIIKIVLFSCFFIIIYWVSVRFAVNFLNLSGKKCM